MTKIKVFKKKLNKGMTKIKVVEKKLKIVMTKIKVFKNFIFIYFHFYSQLT